MKNKNFFSKAVVNNKPSPTVAITFMAQAMKRAGKNIIALSAGEPDFDTPDHIKEAAIKATNKGKTKYAPPEGIPELRESICEKFKRDNQLDYALDQITVGCGAKQPIFNAFFATINPGDEVIVPAPYWVSHADIPILVGGESVTVNCPAENGYKLTPEQLEAAISPRTKWLILNNPSNPSGAGYTADELKNLAEVLLGHEDVWVLTDDIYEFITYDNYEFSTIAQAEPKIYPRTLTVNGVSKTYCMTGWRVGYAAGDRDLIKAMNQIQTQSTTSTSTISQWASVAALTGDHTFIKKNNTVFKQRRDLVVSMLNEIDGVTCPTPEGAFFVYPSCKGLMGRKAPEGNLIKTDEDFAKYLLESVGIAVIHGEAFGLSPHFRISYATSTEILEEACHRIQQACAELT